MSATIYSKPSCPFCVKAKNLLQTQGIPFKEIIVGADVTKEEVSEYVGREITTVPQILIDGEYVGGYTDLAQRYA